MAAKLYLSALVAATVLLLAQVHSFRVNVVAQPLRNFDNVHLLLRGGAAAVEEEFDEDFSEIESSDEEEELDPKLAKSALSAASKAKAKAKTAAKEAVKTTLQASTPEKKKSSGFMKLLTIPYIVKACLNPLVLIAMTKGYWSSLFNLNYLNDKVDTSQNLRSALEEKAKKGGSSSRGKRKMKPGQAKTLSDLPQLNT